MNDNLTSNGIEDVDMVTNSIKAVDNGLDITDVINRSPVKFNQEKATHLGMNEEELKSEIVN